MESIRNLYKIGSGPSSSHTMGPRRAACLFLEATPGAARREVTLYGALAATGKGHLTDRAILEELEPDAPAEIIWRPETFLPFHPNGMKFEAFDANGTLTESITASTAVPANAILSSRGMPSLSNVFSSSGSISLSPCPDLPLAVGSA